LRNSVTIDEAFWPSYNLNVLLPGLTYPNWMEFDVYQPLDIINITAEYNNQGYQYLPGLAANWTVSPDGTTYTFNLRKGVTFSNGDQMNSYQVWMNMYNVYYSIFNTTLFFQYPTIFDTSNVVFGPHTIAMLNDSGLANPNSAALAVMTNTDWPIYTQGPYKIAFHMTAPFESLLGLLGGLPGMIYDAQFAMNHGWPALYGSPAMGYFAAHAIPGTGPYMMTDYVQNSHVDFAQNPTYWGKNLSPSEIHSNPLLDPGHVKQVVIQYKADDLARYTDLANNAAQIATIESQNWNLIADNPTTYGYVQFPSAANIVSSIALNTQKYPMNITNFRLAIEHAINYTQIYQQVFHGDITPFVGPQVPGFKDTYDVGNYPQYSYNVTLAKQLLASTGITNLPTLTWSMPSGFTVFDNLAQIIQSQLAQNLGLNIQLQVSSYSNWIAPYNGATIGNKSTVLALADITFEGAPSYGQVENVPADNWITFVTYHGFNLAFWQTNATDALANALTTSNNQTLINSLLAQAQKDVYEQAPYIWIGVFQLVVGDGSVAYKHSVINSFYFDPMWSGANTAPIFNTITFK
jgi:peptide/nickel transport system substrate-binding protein